MRALFLLSTLLVWSSIGYSKTVYVVRAQGTGVAESDLLAITELVESSIQGVDGYTLSTKPSGSDFELRPKLTKLGAAYFLTVYKRKAGKTLNSKKMKSNSLEDMDTVVTRVVRAVLNEEDVNSNSKVYEVTEEEQVKSQRRFRAQRQTIYSFGTARGENLNEKDPFTSWLIGKNWNIDPDYDLSAYFQFFTSPDSTSAYFNNFGLNLHYFFNRNKNAPYVTGGIGHIRVGVEDGSEYLSQDSESGFALIAGVGMRFFRTSTVNFGLSLDYTALMSQRNLGTVAFMLKIYH